MIQLKLDLNNFPDTRDLLKEVAKSIPSDDKVYEVKINNSNRIISCQRKYTFHKGGKVVKTDYIHFSIPIKPSIGLYYEFRQTKGGKIIVK